MPGSRAAVVPAHHRQDHWDRTDSGNAAAAKTAIRLAQQAGSSKPPPVEAIRTAAHSPGAALRVRPGPFRFDKNPSPGPANRGLRRPDLTSYVADGDG